MKLDFLNLFKVTVHYKKRKIKNDHRSSFNHYYIEFSPNLFSFKIYIYIGCNKKRV